MATQLRSNKMGTSERTRATRFVALNPHRFVLAVISTLLLAFVPATAFAQNDAGADAGDAGDASLPAPPRPTNPVSDLSQRNRDLRARLEATGRERDQVRSELTTVRAERDSVQVQLTQCSSERARLTSELANCQLELCRERSRQQLEATIARVNVIMGRLRAINARLTSIEGRLTTIEHNYASLSAQVAALEATVGQHTTAIEAIQAVNTRQDGEIHDIQAVNTRQDGEIQQAQASVTDTRQQLGNTNRSLRVVGRAVSTLARLIPVLELGAGAMVATPFGPGDALYAFEARAATRWMPTDTFYVSLAATGGVGRIGQLGPGALFGGQLELGYRATSGLRVGVFGSLENVQIFQGVQISATDRVRPGSVGWLGGGGVAVTPRFGDSIGLRLAASIMNGRLGPEEGTANWYGGLKISLAWDVNSTDDPARQARDAVANLPETLPAVTAPTSHPRGEPQAN